MSQIEELTNTGDIGRVLDSLQPMNLSRAARGSQSTCKVKGCTRKQRLFVFYGAIRGYQQRVSVCPEHACDIVNAYINVTHPQGEREEV